MSCCRERASLRWHAAEAQPPSATGEVPPWIYSFAASARWSRARPPGSASHAEALAREGPRDRERPHQGEGGRGAGRLAGPGTDLAGLAADLGTAAGVDGPSRAPELDILVNNLGIFEPKPFEEIPDEDWQRFIEVNFMSGVRLRRIYLPG